MINLRSFYHYGIIGIINTGIHFFVFILFTKVLHISQIFSNLIAFLVAVTFSYYANSKFTFQAKKSLTKYLLYIFCMGTLSVVIGYLGDIYKLYPVITFIIFSATSLILGFLLSKYLIFRD